MAAVFTDGKSGFSSKKKEKSKALEKPSFRTLFWLVTCRQNDKIFGLVLREKVLLYMYWITGS